jgi:type VI secretion system protein ImpM
MRCSLFGKLSAKRDFIALATPRPFLELWEPWIQACMSASQHQLGSTWKQAFLTAPLWRFWLGADLAGTTVMGVFMPSVDGVGRYYPLTLLVVADADSAIPPPDLATQDEWFAVAEEFLLATLDQSRRFEDISAALDNLPSPRIQPIVASSDGILRLGQAMAGNITAGKTFQDALGALRRSNHSTSATATYWWTEGGGDFPPIALCAHRLPDPFHFANMLTGRLTGEAAEGEI